MKFHPSAVLALLSVAALGNAFVVPNQPKTFVSNSNGVASSSTKLFMSETTATKPEAAAGETFEFQAEVGRVMEIIINSLYSDRDVFLRELVSNAADACDKKRFLSITSGSDEAATIEKPSIKIKADSDTNTLMIQDSGVGMTKAELVNNLGRIAQSGTKAFLEALRSGTADVNLIGQFGVGFYSAYLVADKVEVVTKSMQPNSPLLRWTSDANNSFTIEEINDEDDDLMESSGTRLILHLKEDAADYLETTKIEELLQRYSEFIEFPINVWKETTEYKKVPDVEANKDLKEGEEPKMKTVPETKEGYEEMNNQKPIWLRSPKEVSEDEYKDFYKTAFRSSYDDPMKHSHFVLEGQVECKSVLYIPGMLPFELSKDMFDENSRNIRLYVKRVFINDKFEELMPRWLKFVKGVVDSDDLPLNVGREILQKSKVLNIINKRLVRKSLDMMRDLAEDEDNSKYIIFWNNFGKYLKVGVVEDDRNRKEIAPLLRFFSSKSGEEYTSLDQYMETMPEGQKSIYYVTGDGREKTSMSPVIEKLESRGYEVLFATEPLDEICMESLRQYKELDIVDASKENLKMEEDSEDEKLKKEQDTKEYAQVIEYLETLLQGKVNKVTISELLTNSPAALVQGAYGMSPTMQKYMRAQAVATGGSPDAMGGMNQAVLEINPKHPILQDLKNMVSTDKESKETETFAKLMYDVASMTSGYEVGDMGDFAKRVMSVMTTKAKDDVVKDAEVTSSSTSETETEESASEDEDDDDDEEVVKEVEVL